MDFEEDDNIQLFKGGGEEESEEGSDSSDGDNSSEEDVEGDEGSEVRGGEESDGGDGSDGSDGSYGSDGSKIGETDMNMNLFNNMFGGKLEENDNMEVKIININ